MVILRNKQAENFIQNPNDDTQGILIYGQDLGLITHRARSLINYFVADKTDPFQLSKLNSDILKEDPDLLINELDTYSLMGTRKVIHLRLSQDLKKDQVECIMNEDNSNLVIITANEMKPTSILRKGFETNKNYISIPCYSSSSMDIMSLLNEKLIEKDMQMDREAKELLIYSLGDNYENTLSEIDKVLTMNMSSTCTITKKDVENIVVNSSNIIITDLVDLIFEKKTRDISLSYYKTLDQFQPPQILQIVSNHTIKLLDMIAIKEKESTSAKQVVETYKPSFFFKRHNSIQKQLNIWSRQALLEILEILSKTIMDTRSYSEISKEITERSLIKISSIKS
ncbi:MAG: DNA polymerase III subunit delta [Hyphomicrobiales bacterium]|nr:DNA polymerase III subunit delta [Hyphomicrobiales bacterium]